ncbi:hypothetical protein HWV62_23104 [Athelia sp. TMB]|nr:hypothetical protein HWV62_23104 [Athelia sp. TMB]
MAEQPYPKQSPALPVAFKIHDIQCNQLPLKKLGRTGSFYVKISVDSQEQYRTAPAKGRNSVSWNGTCFLEVIGSSFVEIQVYERQALRGVKCAGSLNDSVEKLLEDCSSVPASVTRKLRNVGKLETETTITFSLAIIPQNTGVASKDQVQHVDALAQPPETTGSSTTGANTIPFIIAPAFTTASPESSIDLAQPDITQLQREEALARAREGIYGIHAAPPGTEEQVGQVIGASSDVANALSSFATTWDSLLQKIELFVDVTAKLADVIVAQRDRDDALCNLMETIEDIHSFMTEANSLKVVTSQRKILEDMGRLTVESAYLIRDFTVDKSFWKRIATLTLSGVEAKLKQYDAQFKQLKSAYQERAVVNIEIAALRCLVQVEEIGIPLLISYCTMRTHFCIAKDISFQDKAYAKGAGYDPDKGCLPYTRLGILTELHHWINLPNMDSTPRMVVLTGVAGCGKSAVANTIAHHYDKEKRLGSSVVFERADQAQRHCGNLLSTVARDIANLDAGWESALYQVIKDPALRHTKSIVRQMDHFIFEPAKSLTIIGPIVIVIDALDESGDVAARRDLIRSLASNATELPSNFRVLITARAEDDIWRAFADKRHVQLKPMDSIGHETIDEDISKFIETQLAEIADTLEKKMPQKRWCRGLVDASDHLFQWAATACLAILLKQGGHTPTEILVDLISNRRNLDGLYTTILGREFRENDEVAMSRFRRVMGNILAAKEPLSLQCHSELWRQCDEDDIVESVVGPLGSLLSGTKDTGIAISALHTSFFVFLKDPQRSKMYHVDPTQQDQHLALASLRVMKTKLKFNICGLESSHMRNGAVPDLTARVRNSIDTVLSYSCRFLGAHVESTPHGKDLHNELEEFFLEHFLYWLEVLSLERHINKASRSLSAISMWAQRHDPKLTAFVKDASNFVQVFAPAISESAPHIYMSALPFVPKDSLIAKQYSWRYPNKLRLLTGSLDSWPSALKTIEGHRSTIASVAYSPDGKHIVSGSFDNSIRVWDSETGESERVAGRFTGHTSWHTALVQSVKYSPDGRHIVSGSADKTVCIWGALTGEFVAGPFQGHTDWVNSVAWSPDSKCVVSGSDDNTCRVWHIETGTSVQGIVIEGHSSSVKSVAYSPSGEHIASGASDGTICVWNAETCTIVGIPLQAHDKGVMSIAYSPDGKFIASGSEDKTVRVWNTATNQPVAEPFNGHGETVRSVAYSPDGKFIATGSDDETICVLDAQTGAIVAGPFEGHGGAVLSVTFSPDGRFIASGARDKTVRIWDAKSIGIAARIWEEGRDGQVLAVAYSPDGNHIASGSYDGRIQIWKVETGELVLGPLEGHSGGVRTMAYSPDGKHIISGSGDKTIRIWNSKTGMIVAGPFQRHENCVMTATWSPDGKYIVSASEEKAFCIWDASTNEILLESPAGRMYRVTSLAYSPDGKYIVSGSWGGAVRIWSTETGGIIAGPFEGHKHNVLSVAYSPDGTRVASGSRDKTIRVWDTKTGQIIAKPFRGHHDCVNSVVYSPDGKYIISGSDDKTIRVWDAEAGNTIAGPFPAHTGGVKSVAYSRDGRYLVSGSSDRTIRVWNVEEALVAASANLSGKDDGLSDECTLNKGWVITVSGDLLFWVPSWHRDGLFWPSNTAVISSNPTRLDMSTFVHGARWQDCRGLDMTR